MAGIASHEHATSTSCAVPRGRPEQHTENRNEENNGLSAHHLSAPLEKAILNIQRGQTVVVDMTQK
ncbi:MAG TPA: hypothetical protein VK629_03340, partial [Steroidobacteraceae bacterium]|nr:hypothetical protein [Steroidobacteraceae bacterium]